MSKLQKCIVSIDLAVGDQKGRVRAEVVYQLGSWNQPRGFDASVWPETLETTGGVTYAKYAAGSGYRFSVEKAERFNRKRMDALAESLRTDVRVTAAIAACRVYLENLFGQSEAV